MATTISISKEPLRLEDLENLQMVKHLVLSESVRKKVASCRKYLEHKLAGTDDLFYGINTGFGDLCDVAISKDQIADLQKNLVMSHACGTGEKVPGPIVRLMLLLKIHSLAQGHSGIRTETLDMLIACYNKRITPVIYNQGSLGASGDLVPLAHMSLPLLGLGKVEYKGKIIDSKDALKAEGLKPLKLQSKEGLALLNGTQFMQAYAVYLINESSRYVATAEMIAACSLDAWCCRIEPFHELIHSIRPHRGQQTTAANIRWLLRDSPICAMEKKQVQDPYSFRCIPQVHGAIRDVLDWVSTTILTEINAVTDNPNIFPEENLILSGGNFHGQPLAFALDFLAIALCELGSISERRTFQLLSGERDLPPFLIQESGLNSGLMIPQYTAAALVSENKQLATPASVDSIPSSNGQEDHVSMGANAATKCYRILKNIKSVLSIELMTAAQAMHFRRPMKSGSVVEAFLSDYRKVVAFIDADRPLYDDMKKTLDFLEHEVH